MARVLVIDDEPGYVECIEDLLVRDGYDVATASDCENVQELAERFRPQVAVIDWLLRGRLDGLEIAGRLRASLPSLAIVVITGRSAKEIKSSMAPAGIYGILEKPFEPEELRRLVRLATQHPPSRSASAGGASLQA